MKPLEGIRVLDLSRVLAGPMATQIMAELGADVIKVERPPAGDESRAMAPLLPDGNSAYYYALNRAKRSIVVDLKQDRGRELICDLIESTDVLVENFLPGTMEKLGLGYATVKERNAGLIYIANTGFGQDGPYANRKGYDTIFQALSGLMSLTGQADSPPAKVGVPIADITSALWIVIASLTGLAGRARTGLGARFDVAMMDVQVSQLAIPASRLFAFGEEPSRSGSEHPGRVPSAAFECADGRWLQISVSDQHWWALCQGLQLPELGADPNLKLNAGRLAQRSRIMAALGNAFATRSRAHWAATLRAIDVPAGEINTLTEILEDEHTQARQMVGSFIQPDGTSFAALRTPLRIEGYDDPEIGVPPELGADTQAVLDERLGLTAELIDNLREAGVIG